MGVLPQAAGVAIVQKSQILYKKNNSENFKCVLVIKNNSRNIKTFAIFEYHLQKLDNTACAIPIQRFQVVFGRYSRVGPSVVLLQVHFVLRFDNF